MEKSKSTELVEKRCHVSVTSRRLVSHSILYAHLSFNEVYKVFTFNIDLKECVKATFYYQGMRKILSNLMSKL